jgi:hypothetical protein
MVVNLAEIVLFDIDLVLVERSKLTTESGASRVLRGDGAGRWRGERITAHEAGPYLLGLV